MPIDVPETGDDEKEGTPQDLTHRL
jgi:hypothetical protein